MEHSRKLDFAKNHDMSAQQLDDYLDKPHKTIRLAVSGDVLLTKLETEIVDTPEFQRLRKLHQLGTSLLVYPSAVHTRFEHSLGVLKTAIDIMKAIEDNYHNAESEKKITKDQKRLVRLSAMLHDIANMPFGHTLEDETNVVTTYQEDAERLRPFIGSSSRIGKLIIKYLGKDNHKLLIKLMTAKKIANADVNDSEVCSLINLGESAFMVDIVRNTVCADLLEYIRRDAYFCNIPLSMPDRFLQYLFIHNDDNLKTKRLAIRLWKDNDDEPRQSIISELVQLLETRYFLGERVYFHHAKQISSAMIALAVHHAKYTESEPLKDKDLMWMGDQELVNHLINSKSEIASKLAKMYQNRQLYKRFYSVSSDDLMPYEHLDPKESLKNKYHLDAKNRAKAESALCDRSDLPQGDVIIYCPDPLMYPKLAEMNVTWHNNICCLKDVNNQLLQSKINSLSKSHEKLWKLHVFIHPDISKKDKRRDVLRKQFPAWFGNPNCQIDSDENRGATDAVIQHICYKNNWSLPARAKEDLLTDLCSSSYYKEGKTRKEIEKLIEKYLPGTNASK